MAWIINQSKKIEMITNNPISPGFQILVISQDGPIAILWLFRAFSMLLSINAMLTHIKTKGVIIDLVGEKVNKISRAC